MSHHAELNSWSVNGSVLQLLVSSVFAWQAVIQSTGADMCECTDDLLLAFCTPARMDWHNNAMVTVDFKFWNWLKQNPKCGFPFNAALWRTIMKGSEFDLCWKANIKNWFYDLCFLNSYVSVCQMGVFILSERVAQ